MSGDLIDSSVKATIAEYLREKPKILNNKSSFLVITLKKKSGENNKSHNFSRIHLSLPIILVVKVLKNIRA